MKRSGRGRRQVSQRECRHRVSQREYWGSWQGLTVDLTSFCGWTPGYKVERGLMAAICEFYEQLFNSGQVRLQTGEPAFEQELWEAAGELAAFEDLHRVHLPGRPPELDRECLKWAAGQFYHAAQLAVFRELGEDEIERRLSGPAPTRVRSPSAIYSVDLVFRRLPDLLRIVRAINPDDPLVKQLKEWCREWPLSSVGVPDVGEIDIEPVLSDRCLSLMYTDRILEAQDEVRLNHPEVARLVRGAVGAWPQLSPQLAPRQPDD